MRWTEAPAGQVNAAFQRFMGALGESADSVIVRMNTDAALVDRLALYAEKGCPEPATTSYRRAHEIMGSNFFGIEEAVTHFGIKPANCRIADLTEKIPWSEETLLRCRSTHMLVAVFALCIANIRDKARNLFHVDNDGFDQVAAVEQEVSWHLVRKEPIADSRDKAWFNQQNLLPVDEKVPLAQVMVYSIIGHFLTTGERLFQMCYVRCADQYGVGNHFNLSVGCFREEGGLVINGWADNIPAVFMAVSAEKRRM